MTTPHDANKILGVYINPAGKFTTHIAYLKKKANAFATNIRSSRITVPELTTFLKTIYSPSMMYSLPAVSSNEEELSSVQTNLLGATLQKLGASSKTPTEIRHGPYELGGLNIMDLRTETGIARIKLFRDAIHSDSEVGRLILLSLKITQIEAGIKEPILEFPQITLPYISETWITSIRTFLDLHNIQVTLTETLKVRFNGKNDECIMNPEKLKGYSNQQQLDINLVRLYLRVITLSDMSHPDGNDIKQNMLHGERDPHQETRRSTQGWPRQQQPSASQRRLWKRYIHANYLRYGTKWKRSLGTVLEPHQRINPLPVEPYKHCSRSPTRERTSPDITQTVYATASNVAQTNAKRLSTNCHQSSSVESVQVQKAVNNCFRWRSKRPTINVWLENRFKRQ
jgi:hypothetical protein